MSVPTIVNQEIGNTTFLWCAFLCCVNPLCCCLPFMLDSCLDKNHYCPNCGNNILRKHQRCFEFLGCWSWYHYYISIKFKSSCYNKGKYTEFWVKLYLIIQLSNYQFNDTCICDSAVDFIKIIALHIFNFYGWFKTL